MWKGNWYPPSGEVFQHLLRKRVQSKFLYWSHCAFLAFEKGLSSLFESQPHLVTRLVKARSFSFLPLKRLPIVQEPTHVKSPLSLKSIVPFLPLKELQEPRLQPLRESFLEVLVLFLAFEKTPRANEIFFVCFQVYLY